jgi:hypothetical protein
MLPWISATSRPDDDDATVEISGVTYAYTERKCDQLAGEREWQHTLNISGGLAKS